MIYLDSAATTKPSECILGVMLPYLTSRFGNAGTLYSLGRESAGAVQKAREQVASLLNAKPEQIVFTSGGSEANNLVFAGLKNRLKNENRTHILVSAVEHESVLHAAESLVRDGFNVEYIPVNECGMVSAEEVESRLTPNTGLVSVMYSNNETGTVNPVEDIGTLCTKHGVLFHTDCVQAAGFYPIDVQKIGCDYATISSHKIHGCKGVGALFMKTRVGFEPQIYGGTEQEFGLRGGTENVAGIVGFGKACELAEANRRDDAAWIASLRQRFYAELYHSLEEYGCEDILSINGMPLISPAKILNIRLNGVDGETLLLMLDGKGVCVSAGSACRSHEAEPSYVLKAMGLSNDQARSSIRVSFSGDNWMGEICKAAHIIADCAAALLGGIAE